MNEDRMMQLQAWVDNELSPNEAKEVAAFVVSDTEAKAAVDTLRTLKQSMQVGEPSRTIEIPASLYWDAIARKIELEEVEPTTSHFNFNAIRQWIAPVGALAAIGLFVCFSDQFPAQSPSRNGSGHSDAAGQSERDIDSKDVGVMNLNDPSKLGSLLWLQDQNEQQQFNPGLIDNAER